MKRKPIREWPAVLLRKWVLTAGIGSGFLVIGSILYAVLNDRIMLILSILLALMTVVRCIQLYFQIGLESYEVIEGVCVRIKSTPLRKQRNFTIMTVDGIEHTLIIGRQISVYIGHCYRLYLLNADANECDISCCAPLLQPQFLALQDLGEYKISGEIAERNHDDAENHCNEP